MGKCKICGNDTIERLGYNEMCMYCDRTQIMELSTEDLADNLTVNIFSHKKECFLYEAIRRILLKVEALENRVKEMEREQEE